MTEKILTEGEYRVGISFNPSANPAVDKAKATIASLIDEMFVLVDEMAPGDETAYKAIEYLEIAGMLMVKAITKPARQKTKDVYVDSDVLRQFLDELAGVSKS